MLARVIGLRRYPVKSMLGEEVTSCEVTDRGLEGDRAVALVDVRTGQLVSCKQPRRWGRLFELTAALDGELTVRFPDGRVLSGDGLDEALSEFLGRAVHVVEEHLLDTPGVFFDLAPLHLITTQSMDSLAALQSGSRFDVERFRPNVVLSTSSGPAFPEDDWLGRDLRLGPSVVVRLECHTPRCVMATLAQGDLPADKNVLKTMNKHHRRPFFEVEQPTLGIYAQVLSGGLLRVGDEVAFA